MRNGLAKFVWLIGLILVAVSILLARENSEFINWIESTAGESAVICQRQNGDDFFFVARDSDWIKVASRLDVTSGIGAPRTFVVGWIFEDEDGGHLEIGAPPLDVKNGYSKIGRKTFAENVLLYKDLKLDGLRRIRIGVEFRKYASQSDAPTDLYDLQERNDLQRIPLCMVEF